MTEKSPEPMAVPPAVVTLTPPVLAFGITMATNVVPSLLMGIAATPPMAIFVGLLKLVPVMVTRVPTGPVPGVKPVMVGWEFTTMPDSIATTSIQRLMHFVQTPFSHIGYSVAHNRKLSKSGEIFTTNSLDTNPHSGFLTRNRS